MQGSGLLDVSIVRRGRVDKGRVLPETRPGGDGDGCNKSATFGLAGTKRGKFCCKHAVEGMVDVHNRETCGRRDCLKNPTFGVVGSKNKEFCARHAKEGMVDIQNNRRCGHHGCNKRPSFGEEGNKKAEFCAQHAIREGMVNVLRMARRGKHSASAPGNYTRANKRPRHPGDVPTVPTPVKEEQC